MSLARRSAVRVLDKLGLREPLKAELNRLLAVAGRPPIGDPRVFRDLERLARGPRPRLASGRGRILFYVMRSWGPPTALQVLLAEAAAQRGFEPVFFTCGGPLPLCAIGSILARDPTPCAACYDSVSRHATLLGFPHVRLEDLLEPGERRRAEEQAAALGDEEVDSFVHEGLPLAAWSRVSVLYYLLRGSPGPRARWIEACRRFLVSSLLYQRAVPRLIERVEPQRVLLHNGLFFDERILRHELEAAGIPYVTEERGFQPDTWIFRHDQVAPDYPVRDDFLRLGDRPLSPAEARRLDHYLSGRRQGRQEVSVYWPRIEARAEAIAEELRLDRSRPIVTAFTNILCDSATMEKDVGFAGMVAWLHDTVRFFAARSDAQLVLRVHPAEARMPGFDAGERVLVSLTERLGGAIPENVRVVAAESAVSSYALGALSRFTLVYTSTIGLELALAGHPVVVAGETHYRGLGFTLDVERPAGYPELLERLLDEPPPPPDVERARRYANFFLFEFMLPLPMVRILDDGQVRIPLASLEELLPGRDPTLDLVLEGLLEGLPFWPGAEVQAKHLKAWDSA